MESKGHIWNFSSVGGVKRVNMESGKDLLALETLDQKLWTALSCPVRGLEIDDRTLELMDTDKDGRIRVPEILEAIKWITGLLHNPDLLLQPESRFPLDAINQETEEGKKLYASAKQILENLSLSGSETISVEETSDLARIFADTCFNGDGIITEESAEEESLKVLLRHIITCCGSVPDRNGKAGISIVLADSFFDLCEQYRAWHAQAESNRREVFCFGDATPAAYSAFQLIKPKIEDYFLRCRLAAFDAPAAETLNSLLTRFEVLNPKDLSTCLEEIASYPLAKAEAGKPLPLDGKINPAWTDVLASLVQHSGMVSANESATLTEAEWLNLTKKFQPYAFWLGEKKGTAVEVLGLPAVLEILSGRDKEQLYALLQKDLALESEANHMLLVDKLVRYYRDSYRLLKNFVTFSDFYSPDEKAIFQNGTLYIDQRSCDLCFRVNDMAKHNSMVSLSGMYLIYCECSSKSKNEKMTIVAAMTNGDIDNLVVGRNALFYDRKGADWDATVIKIVENPISIRQAFWSPYRKVARFIETQIDKVASAKEKDVHAGTTGHVEKLAVHADAAVKAPTPPPAPFDVGKFVGIFAAIGLALGAIGSVLASFIAGFLGLTWWKMPFAAMGLILVISGPSMVIAYLKLRKRNLAPILDANGWAINARAIVNIPFGNTLTHLASLPKFAKVNLNDPFTSKKRPFLKSVLFLAILVGAALVLWWKYGNLKALLFR